MSDKIDPQVQIRIIELAEKWVENCRITAQSKEAYINMMAERFDPAYKAITKTVNFE